jgi:5-enolpyruvylshikimate-3-phosphate synthase
MISIIKFFVKVKLLNNSRNTMFMVYFQNVLQSPSPDFNIGAAGTSMRFLTTYWSQLEGKWSIEHYGYRTDEKPVAMNKLPAFPITHHRQTIE